MDKALMDKEVLCILDTRQIQRFMFRSNSFEDTLGGSDLLEHILDDGILYALQNLDPPVPADQYNLSQDPDAPIPFFTDARTQFQLIYCTAGNALFLARTGELAQKIIRKISRYYLDNAYTLNLAAAAVQKTDNLGKDIFELYKKLNAIKASASISDPLSPLPVVMREERTGEPVIKYDKKTGAGISMSSFLRRQEAERRRTVISLTDIVYSEGANRKKYRAVLHIDGNNIGITIGRLLQVTSDYQKGIRIRRSINTRLKNEYEQFVQKTISDLKNYHAHLPMQRQDFSHEFQLIHNNGDDVNCMCTADLVFPFLRFFFKNIESASVGEVDGQRIPLYCCAGICFATEEYDFHSAYNLAEECCESAKKEAKKDCNLRDGLAGNWFDFHICGNHQIQELELMREQIAVTDSNVHLICRPYCLDAEADGKPFSYKTLLSRVQAFKQIRRQHGAKLLDNLRQNYYLDRLIFVDQIQQLKDAGIDMEALLGLPFCRDEDGNTCAAWYDALEVLPFMNSDSNETGRSA